MLSLALCPGAKLNSYRCPMNKTLKHTKAGQPDSPYLGPISQVIACSDTETFANGCAKPLNTKWHSTIEAMDSSGVLLLDSGDKFELI